MREEQGTYFKKIIIIKKTITIFIEKAVIHIFNGTVVTIVLF